MKLKVYSNVMVMNLKDSTPSTSKKEKEERLSKLKKFGRPSLIVKSKLEHHTCSIRIMLIISQTINILEQSKALTFAVRL